jgi:signal peptidase I
MTDLGVEPQEAKKRPSLLRSRVTPSTAALVILAIIALRLWVVETAIVEGRSMETTLLPGDRVLVLKLLHVERFSVVVLDEAGGGGILIKRVVGVPGDTVAMAPRVMRERGRQYLLGSQLYLNGLRYHESYATSTIPASLPPTQVPPDTYFVLGDNRDVSVDSRYYGLVPREGVHGVGVAVVYPLTRLRLLLRPGPSRRTAPLP